MKTHLRRDLWPDYWLGPSNSPKSCDMSQWGSACVGLGHFRSVNSKKKAKVCITFEKPIAAKKSVIDSELIVDHLPTAHAQ